MKSAKVAPAVLGLLGAVYFVAFHWGRFVQDFYPLDNSRVSPNIVASLVQYVGLAVLAYLVYPPFRRAANKWVKGHLQSENQLLHAKLDHIIKHHPAIPDFPAATPGEPPATPPPTSPEKS